MNLRSRIGSLLVLAMLALPVATVSAAVIDSFTFTDVDSWDLKGDSDNETLTAVATAAYSIDAVRWSGTATPNAPLTFGSELRTTLDVGAITTDVQLGSGGTFSADTTFEGIAAGGGTAVSAGDTISFEFWESLDDAADAVDATWNSITFDLIEFNPLTASYSYSGVLLPGAVDWFSFTLCDNITGGLFDFLTIDTEGSDFDTELGLYDAAGNRIANDDDGGTGLLSLLSFGVLGDDLAAGTYYLAIGAWNTIFGDQNFDVSTTSVQRGAYTINLASSVCVTPSVPVPEPGTVLLLGSGLLGLASRCRKQRRT